VLGGGSAGFMAAIALKAKLPELDVQVIRSKEIGVIGVGEGSTIALTLFLHDYLKIDLKRFHEIAQPTWKLGLRFLWGPRPFFHYSFSRGLTNRVVTLPKPTAFYCEEEMENEDPVSAMMLQDRVFERAAQGGPKFHNAFSYHFENEKFVAFLEGSATTLGVEIIDDTVAEVRQDEDGISGLVLRSGQIARADLYVDASGFASLLLRRSLDEPFVGFGSSLFCDRAVVGGWQRDDEVIKPFTTCETMASGWAWQIEHENRINRGYVYCSGFISDDDAQREFLQKNPKITSTRVVPFISGRCRNAWVKNVVAIGNASGFVEPLEATALGVIAMQSRLLADTLIDCDRQPRLTSRREFNAYDARLWDCIRNFIAVHYKYNSRIESEFWRHCRHATDIGDAERIVEVYQENGPTSHWEPTLFDPFDPFQQIGYLALLLGQKVPFRKTYAPTEHERQLWEAQRRHYKETATRSLTVKETLSVIRHPQWKWTT
jgi:tryptophan halogenase